MSANAGYLFYKRYYKAFEDHDWRQVVSAKKASEIKLLEDTKDSITRMNKKIEGLGVDSGYTSPAMGNTALRLATTNPGLLIGSGYSHESGVEDEYKLGFFFDHTTGLPVIPGSSVKGVLRSVFPKSYDQEEKQKGKQDYLKGILEDQTADLKALEAELFEGVVGGERRPLSHRDIFFDAVIDFSTPPAGRVFARDFITPHKDPLKNPVPLKFLKVLPGVVFRFQFELKHHGDTTVEQKKCLFETILCDIGIGAKTNVGYGQLTPGR